MASILYFEELDLLMLLKVRWLYWNAWRIWCFHPSPNFCVSISTPGTELDLLNEANSTYSVPLQPPCRQPGTWVLGTVAEHKGCCRELGIIQPHSRAALAEHHSVSLKCRGVCLSVNPAARLVSRLDLSLALLWSCLQPQCWSVLLDVEAWGCVCHGTAPAMAPVGLTRIPLCSQCHWDVSLPARGGPEIWSSPYLCHAEISSSSSSNPKQTSQWGRKASAKSNLLNSLYRSVEMNFHYPANCCMGRPLTP